MKYKVGDKVKIRTWEDLEKEYGLNKIGQITLPDGFLFSKERENEIKENCPNRILTIIDTDFVPTPHYDVEEMENWGWADCEIEYLIPIPIYTRWEILDL